MKTSFNWLAEFVSGLQARGSAAAAEALTRVGFEVEGTEERGHDLSGVVVAEVIAPPRPHPDADKLRIVRVRAGAHEEDVVCGAPNVPGPGGRVAWARPGAKLPGGLAIAARAVRGVMSPGMLCSEPELGLGDKAEGLLLLDADAPAGADLVEHLGLRDSIFEVNVTPNRPDALSHLGLARELAAALALPLTWPADPVASTVATGPTLDVRVAPEAGCPRYQARFVTDLTVRPSPLAMRLRLQACGIRPISNLVDVTNWILLELGHPLHAFDLDKLSGAIVVRRATAGEPIQTLDGQARALEAGDIVIADARGPVALAGVMGGASSEVTAGTRRVLLEAATFDPKSVRRTSRRLGLISEASYRFERGVDAAGIPAAAKRAAAMLAALGGGSVVAHEVDRLAAPPPPTTIRLPVRRFERVAGRPLAPGSVEQLGRIGVQVKTLGQGTDAVLEATPPTFRRDLEIGEDLIEELLRFSDAYLSQPERGRVLLTSVPSAHPEALADRSRDLLAALGFSEAVTWGFVPRARLQALTNGASVPALSEGVVVKNPISADYEVMRTSLLPGLADALARNLARGVADAALFEVGPVVERGATEASDPTQSDRASGILAGRAPGWLKAGEPLDLHDLKAVVEELLLGLGIASAEYRAPANAPYLHPGVSADVSAAGRVLGHLGELHPIVARRLGLEARAFFFEIRLTGLADARAPLRGVAPPRFPAIGRDISFWIDTGVSAAAQREAFAGASEPLLVDLRVLEDYRDGRHVPAGKKGMLWSLTYRAEERTLTDADADAAHGRVVAALKARFEVGVR